MAGPRVQMDIVLRSASFALLAFLGISGCFGGGLLIADPTGETMGLSVSLLENSPFDDFLAPGILLLLFIGIGNLATAATVMQTRPWFPFLIAVDGISVTIWIIIQMVMVQMAVPQQFVIGSIGLALIVLGLLQWRSPHDMRS